MSDIELVIKKSRKLETLLKDHYYAQGKGLHQLTDNVQDRLPHDLLAQLHYIATIRNKMVHEDGFVLENKAQFIKSCKICERALYPRSKRVVKRAFWSSLLIVCLGALIFYFYHWEKISF